ncbi:carbon-nitrogen hydrolase family protein [Marimonas lutisalis]|uniref:carbon-nitrogen hydrolase family protein n=1 Tax=Marimonas lutisalis TaxID=2545756 RepID=UPI0013757FBD|nr:nitrilase-related carbon-nitrogen hydrolase [Marimonas lutisalis]
MSTDAQTNRNADFAQALGLFVLGFGLFMFCRRSDFLPMIPAMIIVAPIFILRFSRVLPAGRSILFTILGFVAAFNIALWGIFDMGDPVMSLVFNVVRSTIIALYYALPYVIDRLVTPRLGNRLFATLVFPAAMTASMFLSSLPPPIDGTAAKNVFATAPLPLLQIYALAGLWGFVFLWSWLAACVNHAWENGFRLRPTVAAGLAFVVVAGGLFAWGSLRIVNAPDIPTVKVAAVVMPAEVGGPESMVQVFEERMTSPYEATMGHIRAMTAEAAANGAEIVAFNEFAIVITEANHEAARAEFAKIAADNGVWLALPYGWVPQTGKGANRHLLLDDTGTVQADYQKRFLLGFGDFGENAVFAKGAEIIQTADSPYGRIALSICRDMSFPDFARQAGNAGADIMLTGSHEFPKGITLNDPYRAVENGFTHIRPTYDGITYAIDPYGHVLAQMNLGTGKPGIMYVDVPTKGARTLYARFGDWLGWVSMALVVLFAAGAVLFGRSGDRAVAGRPVA